MNIHVPCRLSASTASINHDVPLVPPLERRRLQCHFALVVADVLAFLGGSWLVGYLQAGQGGAGTTIVQAQLALPVFMTIALYNGTYSIAALSRPWLGIQRAGLALLLAFMALIFFAFYSKSSASLSRVSFTLTALSCMIFLAGVRVFVMRRFVAWRCGDRVVNELIIDDGGPEIWLPGAVRISARSMALVPSLDEPDALDRIGLALRNVDRVTVTCPAERRATWALILKGTNIAGEVIDEEVARLGAQGARVAGGHGFLLVSVGPMGLRARALKRLLDLGIACTALVVLAIPLLFVALAIRLEDGGPVFFIQRRMGRGNRFFQMLKFRSMSVTRADRDGAVSTAREDDRITRVGRFIRRTSIDELPQLINVVRGEMSLVGPRPHAVGSQAGDKLFWEVDLRYWQRHCLKPGLSGLAQVRGQRGATEVEADLVDRLQSDLEYLEGWTIWRDLKIIAMTVRVIVHPRAY